VIVVSDCLETHQWCSNTTTKNISVFFVILLTTLKNIGLTRVVLHLSNSLCREPCLLYASENQFVKGTLGIIWNK